MVSDVTISQALQNQRNTNFAQADLASDFSDFLRLLTVQLQNQDPLSPMDSTEFTNQLVAFTGVEQQINTNQKLDDLVALNIGSSFSAAQSYVGNNISYISSEFRFTGGASKIKYSLPAEASEAKVNILDQAGNIIYTTTAATTAGAHDFTWDGSLNNGGRASAGTYQVQIDALDVNKEPIQSTTVVTGRVDGVESQNGQIFLIVGERAVGLGNVLNTTQSQDKLDTSNLMTMALGYVGLDVSYPSTNIVSNGNDPVTVDYTLEGAADRAKIFIYNDTGQLVRTADVNKAAGANSFVWDSRDSFGNPVPSAQYTYTIDAIKTNTNGIDQRVAALSTATGRVSGVETQNGQIFLNIGARKVALSDIRGVNVPPGGGSS